MYLPLPVNEPRIDAMHIPDGFLSAPVAVAGYAVTAVLVAVAAVLRESVRAPDLVARWGGEEFLVFLPETSLEEAISVAQRIQAQLAATRVPYATQRLKVRMTLGVAPMCEDGSVEALLRQADEALYRGKHAGRNRIEVVTAAAA